MAKDLLKSQNVKRQHKVSRRYIYSYFLRKVVAKLCTRQSRKVIWDMINTLVPDTVAVEPTFVALL